jgi:hypothetical protein
MAMTRKDYKVVAKVLKEQRTKNFDTLYQFEIVDAMAQDFARAFEDSNSKFDRKRFLEAVGER